ncbi:MAG: hypothetical protein O3C14_09570, partial [Proteobacteria bacterium]|nr:hypothetical protein [Pseudomonadota bacterium]
MAVFKGLSGIFATGPTSWVLHRREPRGVGVLQLGDVVWRAPDTSEGNRTAGKTASKTTNKNTNETPSETTGKIRANGYLPDIIILEDVVLNPRETHKPVEWQTPNGQENRLGTDSKQPATSQDYSSPVRHDALKSHLRRQLHAQINRWLDENIANLVDDALQATP